MLLIDIGSTFTKLAVADTQAAEIVATVSSPTTIDDVNVGFQRGLDKLRTQGIRESLLAERYASSSAAGGLRMVAIGLVPDLTMEAARRAALGAGAKIVGSFSFRLTASQVLQIESLQPDIILLTGGTDGGEQKTIVHNAHMLAFSITTAPVVMAGNINAVEQVEKVFTAAGKYLRVTDNVMPQINKLSVDAVKEVIRDVFIKHIVVAKGLDKINNYINGIALPTPLAVLEAARTVSEVIEQDIVVVDVGGATTDVHSIGYGFPRDSRVLQKGLPEPYAKRTVEGDLGVRYNIASIVEEIGRENLLARLGDVAATPELQQRLGKLLKGWSKKTETIAQDEFERRLDYCLASAAVEVAINRHCGFIEEMWTPEGKVLVQYGKDLCGIKVIIGTGGPLINSADAEGVLRGAMSSQAQPFILKPKQAKILIDHEYILFSIGLISQTDKQLAKRITQNYMKKLEG